MANKDAVTAFLNVDLDLRGKTADIDVVLRSMQPSVIVLHRAEQDASVELTEDFPSLEETASNLIKLIEGFPPQARNVWNGLEFRKLNIGILAGCKPHAAEFAMSGKTVSSLAAA